MKAQQETKTTIVRKTTVVRIPNTWKIREEHTLLPIKTERKIDGAPTKVWVIRIAWSKTLGLELKSCFRTKKAATAAIKKIVAHGRINQKAHWIACYHYLPKWLTYEK